MRLAEIGCDWSMLQNLNIWDVFSMNEVHMMQRGRRKVASGRRLADAVRSLVNAKGLKLKCFRTAEEVN